MPTTYPNMSLQLPVRGNVGAGVWGDTLDADIALIDAHDHSPGKGPLVPVNGLNINADILFSARYAPTQLHRVQFSEIAVADITAGRRESLFVSDGSGGLVQHELYWQSFLGASVQLTSGSSLNVGAFAGGFTGDFTSVGAVATYTSSSKQYTFETGTGDGHGWARLLTGGVRIGVLNATANNYVEHAVDAAVAAPYTMTWPAALPGATALVQVTSGGVTSFSSTVVSATTFTGLITASSGLTAAANQPVTVSGTGAFKHGTQTIQIPANAFQVTSGSSYRIGAGGAFEGSNAGGTALSASAPILLEQGRRITAIRAYISDSASGPTKLVLSFQRESSTGTQTNLGSTSASAGTGANQTLTLSGLTTTVATLNSYIVSITTSTGTASCQVFMAEVDYDYP